MTPFNFYFLIVFIKIVMKHPVLSFHSPLQVWAIDNKDKKSKRRKMEISLFFQDSSGSKFNVNFYSRFSFLFRWDLRQWRSRGKQNKSGLSTLLSLPSPLYLYLLPFSSSLLFLYIYIYLSLSTYQVHPHSFTLFLPPLSLIINLSHSPSYLPPFLPLLLHYRLFPLSFLIAELHFFSHEPPLIGREAQG